MSYSPSRLARLDCTLLTALSDQEGRAQEAEHHKQDQLQKQREGKGHWKEELASDSESIVCLK